MGTAVTEMILGLVVCLAAYLYIWKVEIPREKRRRRQRLQEMGYGFLNREDY